MIVVFLAGALLLLLIFGYMYSRTWNRALSVRVSFARPHICLGERGELTEEIENRKRQAVPLVEIGFRIPTGLMFIDAENTQKSDYVYKRDLFAVEGMERIVRHYQVEGKKRGYYSPDQLSIHAPSVLFREEYIMDTPAGGFPGMYVYARQVDCSPVLRVLDAILGERESARRLYEDPFVFASIRQYTVHDPMKAINWKASAHTGELMVNTYASVTSLDISIYLDVSMDLNIPFSEDLRELAVSGAASLARNLAARQENVKLSVNISADAGKGPDEPSEEKDSAADQQDPGGEYVSFRIGRQADVLTQMEEYLASDFEKMDVMPFADMIGKTAREKRGRHADEVCVFFSAFDTPDIRRSMHDLLAQQGSGIFVTAVRSAEGRQAEREENLFILPFSDTQQGIPVRDDSDIISE